MTTPKLKPMSIDQLAAAAEKKLKEGILSRGGPQPSERALKMACSLIAKKAQEAWKQAK